MYCPNCGLRQPERHRFCVSCGSSLPTELLAASRSPKVTQLFAGIPTHPLDPAESVLRVSRYSEDIVFESEEGSVTIPGHHVRFSVWTAERPESAISLSDHESDRLARFLRASVDARSAEISV
jgi:hypothetical protein